MMKSYKYLLALCALAVPTVAFATPTTYYLVTGQANANTTIDSDHLMQWLEPSSGQACLTNTCTSFVTSFFNPTFDWDLGGGNFTIKSNGPTADITLSLFDGTVTGAPGALGGTLVASTTVLGSSVTSTYTPTDFLFSGPVTLLTGHHYIAILSSTTGTNGADQYFIKGIDTLSIQSTTTGGGDTEILSDPEAVPEPGTWMMMTSGIALVGLFRKRRSRA